MPVMQKPVIDAVNEQIRKELESAYIYLAMCAHFEAENLSGFASWMRLQSEEEVKHAMRLFDYLNDRGARVELKALNQPPLRFESPLTVFEHAYEHEQKITKSIEQLLETAREHGDHATQVMLHWFVTEQVEEEKNASQVVDQLRLAGDNRAAILFMDRQLGQRSSSD